MVHQGSTRVSRAGHRIPCSIAVAFRGTEYLVDCSIAVAFRLEAVAGLKRAIVTCQGQPPTVVDYGGETISRLEFKATAPGFCALTAQDALGKTAYTNPIWVDAPH
jgi:hypothetical protein